MRLSRHTLWRGTHLEVDAQVISPGLAALGSLSFLAVLSHCRDGKRGWRKALREGKPVRRVTAVRLRESGCDVKRCASHFMATLAVAVQWPRADRRLLHVKRMNGQVTVRMSRKIDQLLSCERTFDRSSARARLHAAASPLMSAGHRMARACH